jgi:hypothetical protein
MLGGYYSKDERQLNACTRYNIVSEKWQSLPPMIFPRENAAACAINETQVIVAGGRSAGGQLTDSVELYDLRENTWKVMTTKLSAPREHVSVISAQKDRAIFFGGCDEHGNEVGTVEEIDFLKVRNSIVKLAPMKTPRAKPSAFLVNDVIYVLGSALDRGKQQPSEGEKYLLKEDRWRPFFQSAEHCRGMSIGPAALLYE